MTFPYQISQDPGWRLPTVLLETELLSVRREAEEKEKLGVKEEVICPLASLETTSRIVLNSLKKQVCVAL